MNRMIQTRRALVVVFVVIGSLNSILSHAAEVFTVKLRKQTQVDGEFRVVEEKATWDPRQTAVIVVDMWDNHTCKSAAQRVVEMAPPMNRVLHAARNRGMLIIHAPSNCMDTYQGTVARKRAQDAPFTAATVKFQWNYFNAEREGPLDARLEQAGCSCDSSEACGGKRNWTREIATLEIKDEDAISDDGQEIYNLLAQHGIQNVIIMGVHTNRCVLGRPFGIRQMVYLHKNVVLCRDLTDSFHRDPGNHFSGLKSIIGHVEKYWCPTLSSECITGASPFTFAADR